MATSSTEDWQGRQVEDGWPSDRLKSRPVWLVRNPDTMAYAEIHEHPLGYQLRAYLKGDLLFTSGSPIRCKRVVPDRPTTGGPLSGENGWPPFGCQPLVPDGGNAWPTIA
jgi:hypothetical protein